MARSLSRESVGLATTPLHYTTCSEEAGRLAGRIRILDFICCLSTSFLAPRRYVGVPLERTYMACWDETPRPIRDLVEPPDPAPHRPRAS